MNTDSVLWLIFALLASGLLLGMMRRRQLFLIGLLKESMQRQSQWDRRRAKADALSALNPSLEGKASLAINRGE